MERRERDTHTHRQRQTYRNMDKYRLSHTFTDKWKQRGTDSIRERWFETDRKTGREDERRVRKKLCLGIIVRQKRKEK